MEMEKDQFVSNDDTLIVKLRVYLSGFLVALVVGAVTGFLVGWFSIWFGSTSLYVIGLVGVAIPAASARAKLGMSKRNLWTALICASGALVSMYVMFLTIDGQGLTWSDKESIWDEFILYAIMAIGVGGMCGLFKEKRTVQQ